MLCGEQAAAGKAPPPTDEQDALGRRGPMSRTSKFKGVTRHRRSGRHAPAPALSCLDPDVDTISAQALQAWGGDRWMFTRQIMARPSLMLLYTGNLALLSSCSTSLTLACM